MRPTRGILPTPLATPNRSHKRVRFHEVDLNDPPTPVKRRCPNIPTASASRTKSNIPSSNRVTVSAFEADRVGASIMKQIDWNTVARRVACNRPPRIYRRAVQSVLVDWQKALAAVEHSDE